MAPYSRWVHSSFRQTLLDYCNDYLDTSDRGSDKTRSKLITRVAQEITSIADAQVEAVTLPDDLEKSLRTWFGNYASGNAKDDRPGRSKSDTRGHPTSARAWTAKSACGHIFADRVSIEQKALSDGGEKDIGKYRAALSKVFDDLSEEEVKQCEDSAIEWNNKPLPDDIQRKLSKTIPTEVTDFLKFINDRTGAAFIAFAAYTNEEGQQTYARYETEGLQFFATRKEHRKGANNIVDMWKEFNLESAEEADSQEQLEFDDKQYPRLPDNVLEMRLHRRKAILRQFMAAVRQFYQLTGRIPWSDIAEHPSRHLKKKSRPDSDYRLEEPSHMKSSGVDAWLQHWLKMQRKGKHPLALKEPSDKNRDATKEPTIKDRRNLKKSKPGYVEPDEDDEMNIDDSISDAAQTNAKGGTDGPLVPKSPHDVASTRSSRRKFLASLSDNLDYKNLLLLLLATKDGELLEGSPPAWVSWQSTDRFLSEAFFNPKSSSSLSAFIRWIQTDPITADNSAIASSSQVELVALGYGLAFRALWISQFPEEYSDVPAHIINSPYPFSEYEQLGHTLRDLVSGYAESIQEIKDYQAEKAQSAKKGKSKDPAGETDDTRVTETAIREHDTAVEGNAASEGNNAAGESTGNAAPHGKGKKGSDGMGSKRPQGLSGVPPSVHYLREEVGLAGLGWETMGAKWRALGSLWLRAEQALSKSGRTDLSFDEVRKSNIPEDWKDWMNAKIMRIDARRPAESFGNTFTDYIKQLPPDTAQVGGTVMDNIWCRPGKTGILGLLLCIYWQAEHSGAGNDWESNIQYVEGIFNAILAVPELQRAKRHRAASGAEGSSKRPRS